MTAARPAPTASVGAVDLRTELRVALVNTWPDISPSVVAVVDDLEDESAVTVIGLMLEHAKAIRAPWAGGKR